MPISHNIPSSHSQTMFEFNPQFSNYHHGTNRHMFNNSLEMMEEENSSGVCSPPLWQNIISPPDDSPVRHGVLLSPTSRAQAIARGKREIMEMVQNMPETSYELSLKDLVEQRNEYADTSVVDHETQSMELENEERSILRMSNYSNKKKGSVKRQESSNKTVGKIVVRNGSTNHNKGLFINMFFPFSSVGSKKKKTSITTSLSFGKDSIKFDKSAADRRDWWWKRYTGSGDSESLGITSSSSGDSTRRSGSSGSSGSSAAARSLHSNSNRKYNDCSSFGCWSFFSSKKRKS